MIPVRISFPRLTVLAACATVAASLHLRAAPAGPEYTRDIKPILEKRCYSCHGRLKQKGELRLDAGALIHKGGKHGPVVSAGHSAESHLIERLTAKDEDERMPPEGKPLPPEQVALIKAWIDAGAGFPKEEKIPSSPADHWAFQPVKRPAVPAVRNPAWCRNPIDRFIRAKLEEAGAAPAPAALPHQLLRRAYLDLVGLPPTPAEQDTFALRAHSMNPALALDAEIDLLLARPEYGERWARHWLDLVRYADSNGYERDAAKPFVWRYRDWVIRALNADVPYSRFITEQLAGDELIDPDAPASRNADLLVATGMLRLGHWDDEPADPDADRYDQLDDIVSTTSQVFLGLTIGCARCHDHKFEPLSTRDYYSMIAVFNPLRRPQDGRTEKTVPSGSPDAPEIYCWQEPATNRPATHVLLRGNPKRTGDEVAPAVPVVLAPKPPAFPEADARTSRRRLGLAQWLAAPDNPLTARVLVNRVWQQHFGVGLVRTPSDFGLMGEEPSHPELLDWLADWFVHDAGGSLKQLHRLILTSNTWRMSRGDRSAETADGGSWSPSKGGYKENGKTGKREDGSVSSPRLPVFPSSPHPLSRVEDPENRLLTHLPYRRLEAEALRDSMLAVSGRLNERMFGPAMFPRIPDAAVEANTDKQSVWKASGEADSSRRTIYAFIKRGLVVPMLEVLDLCDTVNSTARRPVTTVAPQALTLFNGDFVNEQARHFARRLPSEAGDDPARQVELAFKLALCRPPTANERDTLMKFLSSGGSGPANAATMAREQMCRVILNLNEFAYPD